MIPYVAREIFLTKGVGRHREKLTSFEEALRDAQIAMFNIIHVSSIFPPYCKISTPRKGLRKLKPGQVLAVVLSRNETNENHRLIASSIGVAMPRVRSQYGYLSEHHSYGETEDQAGDYAEELAAGMLCTILGIDFDRDAEWSEKKKAWNLSGKIVRTTNVSQSAVGIKGVWTTVITGAVLIP
jgi:arginine decarboxylase